MTFGLSATAVVGLAGAAAGLYSTYQSSKAAGNAANAQSNAAQAGISEQDKQFQAVQALLAPYTTAGTGALTSQQNLLGTNGADAQAKAIAALQASPQYTSQLAAGNNNILQNASATGNLRGGNTQAALAQFAPSLLSQTISDQYSRLGGMVSIGQNAAAGVGNAGMQTGNSVAALLQQQGAAQAGGALAAGKANAGYAGAIAGGLGTYYGLGGRFGASTGLGYDYSNTYNPDAANGGFGYKNGTGGF